MSIQGIPIFNSIQSILGATDQRQGCRLVDLIDDATRVFVTGAGRSGLVARFFAMRLMQIGYRVYVVGEVVTPSINHNDLLIVVSGSGTTKSMIEHSRTATTKGAVVALVSMSNTPVVRADVTLQIGKPELYAANSLPLGTAFELSALLFLEDSITQMMAKNGVLEQDMRVRHANLE
jgi:6-phospho 3-hexuloisomerase